ncbi:MAG: hypothetical protein WCS87_15030 [Methylococcaceae bacterium]
MALDTGILAGMTALTKIFCPGLVGSQIPKTAHDIVMIVDNFINLNRDLFVAPITQLRV